MMLNFLLPPRCVLCDKVLSKNANICSDCFNKLNFISNPYCAKCGYPFFNNTSVNNLCGTCIKDDKPLFNITRSAFIYDDISRKMILDFKFFDKTQNLKMLSKWLNQAGKDIFESGVDVIIPVPLHFIRLIKRKYNQSALLAKEVGKTQKIKVDYFSLKKKKYTKPQTKFLGAKRRRNIKNSFIIKKPEHIKGKKILLIDDVMTTGSTLKECAKVLIKAGAKEVNVLTLARVI